MTRCLVNPLPVHYDALNNGSSKGLPFTNASRWVRDLLPITICPCESILNGIFERKNSHALTKDKLKPVRIV